MQHLAPVSASLYNKGIIHSATYTLEGFIHIFLGEKMRHIQVTQPGLELGEAGPLRLSHTPPPCPWPQNPDEKCWPRPLISCEGSICLGPPGLSLWPVPQPASSPSHHTRPSGSGSLARRGLRGWGLHDGSPRAPPGRGLLGQETCGRPKLAQLPPLVNPEGKYVGKAAALPWAGLATSSESGEFIREETEATAEEPDPARLQQPPLGPSLQKDQVSGDRLPFGH